MADTSNFRNQLLSALQTDYGYDQLVGLAQAHGTPLLVLDAKKVKSQHQQISEAMPMVTPHFAVKSCPLPELLKIYKSMGAYLDVATSGELDMLQELNYDPKLLIYTHPHPKPKDLARAYEFGIRSFVIDDASELSKYESFKEDSALNIRLSFSNDKAAINLSYKFGTTPEDALLILKQALEQGFNVSGVCFHVGSQVEDPSVYAEALEQTHAFMQTAKQQYQHTFTDLDIGGGFPSPYTHNVQTIQEIGAVINPLLEKYFSDFKIRSEPGRYLINVCMFLLTSVISTSVRQGHNWLFIDDGVYGSFTDMISGHSEYVLYALSELQDAKADTHYVVGGPTCDSIDVISHDAILPKLQPDDLIISPNMGAYSWALLTTFNSIPKPKITIINS